MVCAVIHGKCLRFGHLLKFVDSSFKGSWLSSVARPSRKNCVACQLYSIDSFLLGTRCSPGSWIHSGTHSSGWDPKWEAYLVR
jgi:hypothetical protein